MENLKIDFEKRKFKKYNNETIEDIVSYITDYVKRSDDIRVVVGCDSQQKRSYTLYALTIIMFDNILHKGAHVIYIKIRTKKQRVLAERLTQESVFSLELADWLDENLEGLYNKPNFEPNEYDGSIPTKKIEIHVDINPVYGRNKQNKSHQVYKGIMGMLCACGFRVKSKPVSYAASSAADSLVKR